MPDPSNLHTLTGGRRTAQVRRERIIAAARTLFAQHGFDGTGMAQIARESQVLVGQIYRDFAGKEDLIAAIVERDLADLLDDPQLANAMASGDADRLSQWVRGFIGNTMDEDMRKVLAHILSEGTRNPRIAVILEQANQSLRDRIASAAQIWIPDPEKGAERLALADLILTVCGALHHRRIFGLPANPHITQKMIALVEAEVERVSTPG
ncbi:AcrR family transcriptional regulator [Novosphingobium chloroacetimidivorans]|uniref:AcrR family transcriptional regulator n=1 Tax=Novosphingobium chloroacetimidivorans TaxID=1428314 RepID=A0A7W7NXR5_9SPHN|nr:TetR/AcrR family transcriptional regulator [Novosphingobium chloroacetimidivorans]MBB4859402.1 AcrR family transcriptional regulator [Novosphingobium chloroacetimidivorans]